MGNIQRNVILLENKAKKSTYRFQKNLDSRNNKPLVFLGQYSSIFFLPEKQRPFNSAREITPEHPTIQLFSDKSKGLNVFKVVNYYLILLYQKCNRLGLVRKKDFLPIFGVRPKSELLVGKSKTSYFIYFRQVYSLQPHLPFITH